MEFNRNNNSGSIIIGRNYVNPLFSSTEDLTQFETETETETETDENIKTEIRSIKSEIKEIRLCIESINDRIQNITGSCNNMDRHISFIDEVYSTIRKPMEFIFNKITYLSGGERLVLEDTP